jgi:hypothetical protein
MRIPMAITAAVAMVFTFATAAWAEPAWRPPFDLSPAYVDIDDATVTVGSSGDALALWDSSDGSPDQVWSVSSLGGGAFSAPVRLSTAGEDSYNPQAGVDDEGNASVVWLNIGATSFIEASARPAGGSFGPIDNVGGTQAFAPRLAVDEAGGAVALFRDENANHAAYRPPGGTFSDPDPISGEGGNPGRGNIASSPNGDTIAVWERKFGPPVLTFAAFRPAGGVFDEEEVISEPDAFTERPDIAMNAAGDAVAVWLHDTGSEWVVKAATRPAGGSFSPGTTVSELGSDARAPSVSLDDAGNTVVAWDQPDADATRRVHAATRAPGGTFSDPVLLSADGEEATAPSLAAGAAGQAVVVWARGTGGTTRNAQAVVRGPTGGFSDVITLSADGTNVIDPVVGMDDAGNTFAVWMAVGDAPRAQGAVFDTTAPDLRDVVVPATGTVGLPVNVSAAPYDQWSPVVTTWSFGDGDPTVGDAASHTYTAPGVYDVVVNAADAVGNVTTETRQITVAPGAVAQLPPALPPVVALLSRLRISPRAFAAAARGPSAAQRRRAGAAVSYLLDAAATVRFTVRRRARGRRVGGRCVKPARRNRARRRCVRFVSVRGSFDRASVAAANRFRFSGRLRGRKLRPGRYRLVATPRLGTVRGTPRRRGFRIVRRR